MTAMLSMPPKLLTAAEFAARPGHGPVELVNGVIQELPVPEQLHGWLCALLGTAIFNWATEHDLGRATSNDSFVKTRMDPDTVRGGDWCYFSYDRIPRGQFPGGMLDVVPNLVLEVRSPSDRLNALMAKTLEYLAAGVAVVVVVNPQNESVVVYRDAQEPQTFLRADTLTVPDVLPGFTFPVARLFG